MENESDEVKQLKLKIQKLEKIKAALMKRVESSTAMQGNAFALFEGNILLQKEVNKKTQQIEKDRLELKKLKQALDASVLISETDKGGMIKYVNTNFCTTSGYSEQELVGKAHNIVNSGIHPPSFWEDFWKALRKGRSFRAEICNRRKNGDLYWIEQTVFPLFDAEDRIKGYSSVSIDVSDKKSHQEKSLHQAKLASIGELAAGIGHEINNPLAIASTNATFVLKQLSKENVDLEKVRDRIEKIENANKRIRKIIDGLRTYARMNSDDMMKVSLTEAVTSTISLISEIYQKKGIQLASEIGKEELFILGDTGKLQQIIMNLISNAKDATEENTERLIKIKIYSKDDKVVLSVKDNGCGIPTEIKDKILAPFFTTKPPGKGTGMGLGVVRELTEYFNGNLDIYSKVGEGSEFVLSFPNIQ